MYVLMLVSTMIMLLGLMTYGRLETFKGILVIRNEFKVYMEQRERTYLNERNAYYYDDTVATSQERADKISNAKNPASSTLSFNLFVNAEERESHPKELSELITLTKNLMTYLYGEKPYFEKLKEKRPDFTTEIIRKMIDVTASKKLQKKEEIATLDLGDHELNEVFTYMMKDEEFPLLDFITTTKNKLKIRIFLASPELLNAIFLNDSIVNEIEVARKNYHTSAVQGAPVTELSEQFKAQFQNLAKSGHDLLDFGVSKTNPPKIRQDKDKQLKR